MDIINDILRSMHIRGRVCYHVELCSGSGMALDSRGRFVMHSVLEGGCWAGDCATGTRKKLAAGDVLLLPRGGGYWFSDLPECPDRASRACLDEPFFSSVSNRLPFARALARPQIRESLVAMHKDPHRNWTVERLAEVSGMSRSAFAQCFTEHVGVPVMRYLTLMRMYRALELIRSGESSFAEIPRRVGYLSQVAFQKAFKRVHGFTPAQAKLGVQLPYRVG